MSLDDIVVVRKKAEAAVQDMAAGELKTGAFEVILSALLSGAAAGSGTAVNSQLNAKQVGGTSLAERIALVAEEGFFAQPRSLAEIQNALTEHGWHYPQENLSTPLVRLVRQRQLRRLRSADGSKKVWKYSLP